jgi:hypothetical protein
VIKGFGRGSKECVDFLFLSRASISSFSQQLASSVLQQGKQAHRVARHLAIIITFGGWGWPRT